MVRLLKYLALTTGAVCALIGLYHLALGIHSVPGEAMAGATVDSRERFYGAVFLGYGLSWVWAARQSPLPTAAIHFLAGILLLGGVGRIISVIELGWPHWFQVVLMVIEIVLPAIFFYLAAAAAPGVGRGTRTAEEWA